MNRASLRVVLYVSAALLVVAMLKLGFWQLSRADEKQGIQDFVSTQNKKEIDVGVEAISVDNLYQRAFGVGEYIVEHSILIDNQVHEGRVGYHVLTPFRFEKNNQIILVNSGWVPVGASREIKPIISLPEGRINISGRLQRPHSQPPIWRDNHLLVQDRAWQYLALDEFEKRTQLTVASLILELDPSLVGVGGYERKWRVYDDTWINRHKAYALQWFSLAVAFILMCLMLEFRSRKSLKQLASTRNSKDA